MNTRCLHHLLPLAVIISLLPSSLTAQPVPRTAEIPLCPSTAPPDYTWVCRSSSAAVLADGTFAIGEFGDSRHEEQYSLWNFFARVETLDTSGHLLGGTALDRGSIQSDVYPEEPAVTAAGGAGFVAAWHKVLYDESDIQMAWPGMEDYVVVSDSREGFCCWSPRIASNAAGGTVAAWQESDGCSGVSLTSVGVRAFDAIGQPLTPILHVSPVSPANQVEQPRVSIDASGRFRVLWSERSLESTVLRGQRFTRDGQLLGPGLMIREDGVPLASAILADGSLVSVWRGQSSLWLQRYDASGSPLGLPRPDSGISPGAAFIAIASDPRGNLVLLWQDGNRPRARLFNRELVPQGKPFNAGPAGSSAESIALAGTGFFITVRAQPDSSYEQHPVARVWQARHEADACVRRGNLFLCDAANDGGTAESSLALGEGHPAEIPFLADWDGDGRADPCLYRGGRFFCDTGHDNGTDVRSPAVGTTGDKPLLGDLNGDGKADPCVRRGAAVLCDLARDGGAKDLRIVFGVPGDKVLLGDPNGDSKDDPCLLRSGRLLCDTAHDGNLAELTLDLRPLNAQGPTLFGDVNGDGRDEACRFTGDRFVCGVYPTKGGVPAGRIEIGFGRPGDVPLLGDLDAF